MAEKMIPCKVCGKMFEPCGYCQKHQDVFRWRNFACSLECANKYVAEAIAYREKDKKAEVKEEVQPVKEEKNETVIESVEEIAVDTVEEIVKTEAVSVNETPKKIKKRNYSN